MKTNLNVFSTSLENMKKMVLMAYLFHIFSIGVDVGMPRSSSEPNSLDLNMYRYKNITGYLKNLNTMTKKEKGKVLTLWEEVH